MFLETQRLIIRTPHIDDIEALLELYTDDQVTRYVGGPKNTEQLRTVILQEIEKGPRSFQFWTVLAKETRLFVGDAGLIQKQVEGENFVELNYFFTAQSWGNGFATEVAKALVKHAFENLKLEKLIALIHPENLASKRVAEKAGFKFERNVVTQSGNPRQLFSIG